MKLLRKRFVLPLILILVSSCSLTHYSDTSYGYGTFWTYHLFEGGQKNIDKLISLVSSSSLACDNASNNYAKGIAAINKSGRAVVDDFLLEELKLGVEISEKTNGIFSLFTGSLTDLWLANLNNGLLPKDFEIAAEIERISQTSLSFNGNEVIKNGDGKLDLGAIGKGYCLTLLKEKLDQDSISSYWISGGGSSILFGTNPNGKDGFTTVELEDLPGKSIYAKNTSLSVSSCRKQLYEIEGHRYSHIVNPFSGSAEVVNDAVIALGENPAIADALTTVVYLEGTQNIAFYEQEFHLKFLVIKQEKVIYSSDGIELFG